MRAAREARSISSTRVEPAEVEADHRPVVAVRRLDAADHRRAAAVRDDHRVASTRPVEDRDHVRLVGGEGDHVGRPAPVAVEGAHDVAERLAVGVPGPGHVVGAAPPDDRVGWHQPGRPQVELGGRGGLDDLELGAAHQWGDQRRQVELLGPTSALALEPPPPEAAFPRHTGERRSSRPRAGPKVTLTVGFGPALVHVAEGEGFEPSVRSTHTRFPGVPIRPLSHPSG